MYCKFSLRYASASCIDSRAQVNSSPQCDCDCVPVLWQWIWKYMDFASVPLCHCIYYHLGETQMREQIVFIYHKRETLAHTNKHTHRILSAAVVVAHHCHLGLVCILSLFVMCIWNCRSFSVFMLHMRLHRCEQSEFRKQEENKLMWIHHCQCISSLWGQSDLHTHSDHWNAYLADCVMVDGLFRVTCEREPKTCNCIQLRRI